MAAQGIYMDAHDIYMAANGIYMAAQGIYMVAQGIYVIYMPVVKGICIICCPVIFLSCQKLPCPEFKPSSFTSCTVVFTTVSSGLQKLVIVMIFISEDINYIYAVRSGYIQTYSRLDLRFFFSVKKLPWAAIYDLGPR